MTYYDLHTKIPGVGKVTIRGIVEGEHIAFYNPSDESEVVLRVTTERAAELAMLHPRDQHRMNLKLERHEIHLGRDYTVEPMKVMQCPHCNAPITWIDVDFLLHSIPWCHEWRKAHPKG